jgi:hypothetical protein
LITTYAFPRLLIWWHITNQVQKGKCLFDISKKQAELFNKFGKFIRHAMHYHGEDCFFASNAIKNRLQGSPFGSNQTGRKTKGAIGPLFCDRE